MDQYQEKCAKCNGARVGHAYVCSFLFVCVFTYVLERGSHWQCINRYACHCFFLRAAAAGQSQPRRDDCDLVDKP